jgi:hypothetical protein
MSGNELFIDGSKFKAVNAKKKKFTPKKAKDQIARIESNISKYLSRLASAYVNGKVETNTSLMKDKLAWLKNRIFLTTYSKSWLRI